MPFYKMQDLSETDQIETESAVKLQKFYTKIY